MQVVPKETAPPSVVSELAEYHAAQEWLAGETSGALLVSYSTENEGQTKEEIIGYSQFMSAHRDGSPHYLCLNFTIGSIEVSGDNLRPVFLLFHPPGRVKELVIFDAARHQQPKPGEPLIRSVRYVSRAQAQQATGGSDA